MQLFKMCEKNLFYQFPCSELFWSVFSRMRTEYGEIRSIFPHSVRMRENVNQSNYEHGHFHAVFYRTGKKGFFRTFKTGAWNCKINWFYIFIKIVGTNISSSVNSYLLSKGFISINSTNPVCNQR